MRIPTIVTLVATSCGLVGCGSAGSPAASRPNPPGPIVLSAFIGHRAVRVSPNRLGAGPVLLTVANESPSAVALTLTRSGAALARTAPINPGGVTQVKVELSRGAYTVSAIATAPRSDAARNRALGHTLTTTVRVGAPRAGAGDQVLQP
jgi:hypothetical protein